jgi:hypothetical protein
MTARRRDGTTPQRRLERYYKAVLHFDGIQKPSRFDNVEAEDLVT